MSNLDQIKQKILQDAQQEAGRILEGAKSQADEKLENARKEAREQAEALLGRAQKEGPNIRDRVISGKDREARSLVLEAKQNLVDRVFHLAKEQMATMKEEDYEKILDAFLLNHRYDRDTVLEIPENRSYRTNKVEVKPSSEIQSGFRVVKDGIRENYEFSEIANYLRESLEADIIRQITER